MLCYGRDVSAPRTARARVRAQLTEEILGAAHEEMVEHGAAGLSLRAVARRLEMVPSAVYRYFPSRDALLTALIVDAYVALADAAESVDQPGRLPPLDRWLAVTAGVRRWAHAHRHEWALLYGSPVPGYQGSADTTAASLRVTRVLCQVFVDAGPQPGHLSPAGPALRDAVAPIEQDLLPGFEPEVVAAALMAWTQVFGMVTLELFGHYVGATTDFDVVFDHSMRVAAGLVGLAPG
jgi:AcrR family transcriptional regulator